MGLFRLVVPVLVSGGVIAACSGGSNTVTVGNYDLPDSAISTGSDATVTSGDGASPGDDDAAPPADATADDVTSPGDASTADAADATAGDAGVAPDDAGDASAADAGDAAPADAAPTDGGTFVCGTAACTVGKEYCQITRLIAIDPVPTSIIVIDGGLLKDAGTTPLIVHKCVALPECDSSDLCSCITPACTCTDSGAGITNNCTTSGGPVPL